MSSQRLAIEFCKDRSAEKHACTHNPADMVAEHGLGVKPDVENRRAAWRIIARVELMEKSEGNELETALSREYAASVTAGLQMKRASFHRSAQASRWKCAST